MGFFKVLKIMQLRTKDKGIFIGFIGVPGVGKSSLTEALAKQLEAKAFIEPGEAYWPIDHTKPWHTQVDVLEKWVCESNRQNFSDARAIADAGGKAIADAGIFLVNREIIYADSCAFWYGHLKKEHKDEIYKMAVADWSNSPCPDVLVLLETDEDTWLRFLRQRARSADSDETFLSDYPAQQADIARAAEQFAKDRGIKFITYQNTTQTPEQNALLLWKKLESLY